MKKIFFIAMISCLGIFTANAQSTKFSLTGGFVSGTAEVKGGGLTVSNSESGFYFGAGATFSVAEQSNIYAELAYMNIDETNFVQLPVLFQYMVGSNFGILVGPQFTLTAEESVPDFSNFAVGLSGGLSYDFSEDFYGTARYTYQLTNTYTGDLDITARINYLNIGVGYRF